MTIVLGLLTACSSEDTITGGDIAEASIVIVLPDNTETPYDIDVDEGTSVRATLYEKRLIDDENNEADMVQTIDGYTVEAGYQWIPCDKDGNLLEA